MKKMSCKKGWLSQLKHIFFKDTPSVSALAMSIFFIYVTYQHMSKPSLVKLDIRDAYEITGRVEWRKVSTGKGSQELLTFKLDSSHEVFSLPDYSGFAYGKAHAQVMIGVILTVFIHEDVRSGPIWSPKENAKVVMLYIEDQPIFSSEDFKRFTAEQTYVVPWILAFCTLGMMFMYYVFITDKPKATKRKKQKRTRKK